MGGRERGRQVRCFKICVDAQQREQGAVSPGSVGGLFICLCPRGRPFPFPACVLILVLYSKTTNETYNRCHGALLGTSSEKNKTPAGPGSHVVSCCVGRQSGTWPSRRLLVTNELRLAWCNLHCD